MNTSSQTNLQFLRRGRSARPMPTMQLEALRDARRLTQVQLAQLLQISQGAVSKAERRNDMFVSTLREYVRAIGGCLEIRAVFPEGEVLIDQFNDKSFDNKSADADETDTARKLDAVSAASVSPEFNS